MKSFLVSLTIIVWICVFGLVFIHFCPIQSNDFYYSCVEPLTNPEFHEIYDNVYVNEALDEEAEKEYVRILDKYMGILPLYQHDYKIILTNEEFTTDAPHAQGYKIAAITNHKDKTIKIKYGQLERSLLHEIGHAVDRYEDYSQTAEFQDLYNKVPHDTYYSCTAREYFARCYQLYTVGSLTDVAEKAYFDRLVYGYSFVIGG